MVPATSTPEASPPRDLTGGELAANLRLLIMRLHRQLRAHAGADLSPTLVSALATVERYGPLTLGDLAAYQRVSPPSVTRVVAALEGAGLVSRATDVSDRRVARVTLTAAGRRTLQRARTRKTAYLAKRLGTLDDADLTALRAALPALERLLETDS